MMRKYRRDCSGSVGDVKKSKWVFGFLKNSVWKLSFEVFNMFGIGLVFAGFQVGRKG